MATDGRLGPSGTGRHPTSGVVLPTSEGLPRRSPRSASGRRRGPASTARSGRRAPSRSSPCLLGGGRRSGGVLHGVQQVTTKSGHRRSTCRGPYDDEVRRRRKEVVLRQVSSCCSELPSQAIADDGGADRARQCERDRRMLGVSEQRDDHGEWPAPCANTVGTKATEGVTSADPIDQADSL